jgi:hypothetical protein
MAKGGVRIPILSEFKPQGIDKAIKEFQKLETTTQKIGFGLQKAFVPAGIAIGGLVAAALPAVKAAADLEEATSKINVVFGESAKSIQNFADTAATSLGQSKQTVFDAAGVFGTFGKSAGLAGQDLATFTTDFITLASDLASFNNTTPEQAIEAIGAALRGESEPLRTYGVLLDDATLKAQAMEMGIYDGVGALTQQEKILAAQQAIFKQTGDAQGDFTRTSESLTNQMKIAEAEIANLSAELGQALLPFATKLVGVFRDMVGLVSSNKEVFTVLAVAVGATAGAVVAANIAMKAYAGLQTVVKVANAVLGTSFQLTATQTAKFVGGLAGVGIAVGAAVFVYQDYMRAKNAVKDLTGELVPLLQSEAGGFDAVAQKQLGAILAATENQKAIEALGFSSQQYFAFLKGEAVPELDFLRQAAEKGVNGLYDLGARFGKDSVEVHNFAIELNTMRQGLENAAGETQRLDVVTAQTSDTMEVAARSAEEMAAAVEAVSRDMSAYREALSRAVASTTAWRDALRESARNGADSFNDFQVDAQTSIEEFRQSLIDSAVNAHQWQNNLVTVARNTSPEFARYLADMGVAGADLVADLAADGDEARRVMEAFELNAAVMNRDVVAEFDGTAEGVRRRMDDVKKAVENGLPPSADMRQKAMAIGDAIYLGIVDALNAGQTNVAYAAAALADTAIYSGKKAIRASSPSRAAADEIGRPIAEGVALGIDKGAYLASDSIMSMMDDVIAQGVDAAKDLVRTIEDEIGQIFSAIGARRSEERMLKRVGDAETDLADAKKNLAIITRGAGKDSAEYAAAQRDLEDAQWRLADANDRFFDTQQKVNKAQTDVTAALNEFGFGSPAWAEAIRTLDKENRNLEQAARNVQDREGELTAARETSKSVLNGYTADSMEYRAAVEAVETAESKLKDANYDLLDSQAKLIEKGPQFEDQFRKIATAAGLEGAEIDKLIQRHKDLGAARAGQAEAERQAAIMDQQSANIRASTPAPKAPTPAPVKPPVKPVKPPLTAADFAPFFPSSTVTVKAAPPKVSRQAGGPIPGPTGLGVPTLAHGGEYVLSADVVSAIKRGAPSRGLGRGGAVGGGGGNVINVTVTSADPQAVVEAIRRYNRTNGPAPFRVAP